MHDIRNQNLSVGDRAPDFSLPDSSQQLVTLRSLLQKGCAVVFFYPKDETYGCIKEVCAFRDAYEDFVAAGCQVVGISGDSQQSHQAFARHHRLAYPLLTDALGEARKSYGVRKTLGLMPGRVTFVIDKEGIVRHRFEGQFNIQGHVQEALAIVKQLQQ